MKLTPADIRNVVLLSVATFAAGFIMPAIPYVGLPMAAFALGWIAYRFGSVPSIAVALVAAALVAVFGPTVMGIGLLDALFVAVALLVAGPGTAWALRRHSALSVVAFTSLIITGAYLVAPIGAQTLKDSLVFTRAFLDTLATSGQVADPAALKASAAALLAETTIVWPSRVAYLMGIGMLLAVPLVSRAGRALGQQVNRYPALAEADLSFNLVWPTIAGLALVAAGSYWGAGRGMLYAVGLNLLMVVRPALVLQGLSVFAALYRKIEVGRVMRTLGFALLGLTEILLPSVSVLGVVDLFMNLRKISRGLVTATMDSDR